MNFSKLDENRFKETALLGGFVIFCFSLSVFRAFYVGGKGFLFLNWNLFLAIIPWLLSRILERNSRLNNKRFLLFALLGVWLLFFPNAPYILTDLFHLDFQSPMPIWFDLILILSFAWTGLLFGLLSLWHIELQLRKWFSANTIRAIIVTLLFASSFGIYLGRYLRWNSWDILQNPLGLFNDVFSRFVTPFDHPRTWGMTILMGIFLNMLYASFHLIKRKSTHHQNA